MKRFEPDFEIIKMDAEIGSYQEDFEPERDVPDATQARPKEAERPNGSDAAG